MTLAELITALEAADPDRVVPHGFTHPHSYRGYYNELAFEPAANVTVAAMLADARSALYATYQGWKGGDFTMSDSTDCWLSMEGCASGDTISALLLQLMLAEPSPAPAPAEALPATGDPMSQPEPLTEQQLDEYAQLIARTTPSGAAVASPGMGAALLAEVRRLRATLATAVALHEKGEHNGLAICLHCAQQMYPPPETGIWSESAYPCATLQALGIDEERPAVVSAADQTGQTR